MSKTEESNLWFSSSSKTMMEEIQGSLLTLGYIASRADPCLFTRKESNTYSSLIIYVDYGGIYGSKLSKHFVVNDSGEMKTCIGCEILTTEQKTLCTFISLN
jgi:hypothetical protein